MFSHLIRFWKNHEIHSDNSFEIFQKNVDRQKIDLVKLLQELKKKGKTVIGCEAQKGNIYIKASNLYDENIFFTKEHSILLSSIKTNESNPKFKVLEIALMFLALSS